MTDAKGFWFFGVIAMCAVMCPLVSANASDPAGNAKPAYDDYAVVLARHVDDNGLVDYAGLKKARAPLDGFVKGLARADRAAYDSWPAAERIAWWINAYNALTLRAVIDHYPIEGAVTGGTGAGSDYPQNSIRRIPGVWDKLEFEVMATRMTLDHIEHKILRAGFKEPRIHAALVCAAISCPPLRREPFTGARLDNQLDDQVRRFLSRRGSFQIDREKGAVHLSSIFDWFGEDFAGFAGAVSVAGGLGAKEKAVLGFAAKYLDGGDRDYIAAGKYTVTYTPYDWTLNER
jgi:hypothetical protein